jgi:hypothetical protein
VSVHHTGHATLGVEPGEAGSGALLQEQLVLEIHSGLSGTWASSSIRGVPPAMGISMTRLPAVYAMRDPSGEILGPVPPSGTADGMRGRIREASIPELGRVPLRDAYTTKSPVGEIDRLRRAAPKLLLDVVAP